jgi:hypothetical protein
MNWPNPRWIRLRSMLGSVVETAQAIIAHALILKRTIQRMMFG